MAEAIVLPHQQQSSDPVGEFGANVIQAGRNCLDWFTGLISDTPPSVPDVVPAPDTPSPIDPSPTTLSPPAQGDVLLTPTIASGLVSTASQSGTLYNPGRTYDDAVREAQKDYPGKAGKKQWHHLIPKYLGGKADGLTVRIDAALHQKITNAFRSQWRYGKGKKPDEGELERILKWVYDQYRLPPPTVA